MLEIDIYWDLRSTDSLRHTGVGKHVIEAVSSLSADSTVDLRILLAKDQTSLWEGQASSHGWEAIPIVVLPFTNKRGRLLAGLGISPGLDRLSHGRDVIYSPMELLLAPRHVPYVNTIHGLPCFEEALPSRTYRSGRYRVERLKQKYFLSCCRRFCRRSFVVSEYLRQQLKERFGWQDTQMHTVYNGADARFFSSAPSCDVSAERSSRQIRLLQVGGANAFDGGPDLLKVAHYLEKYHPDAEIWIVGDRHEPPWESELRNMRNVVWCGFLKSEQLLMKMREASALLYVPCVESFGIIGVEAMAAGLPVLAQSSTSLPEVLGEAACWLDASDPASIERGLELTCRDAEARSALIDRARERAASFTWGHTTARIRSGLESAVA